MPTAAIGAAMPQIVTGVATLGSGLIGASSASRAANAQAKAGASALKHAGFREATRDKNRAQAWDHYQKQYQDWRGFTINQLGEPAGGGGAAATPAVAQTTEPAAAEDGTLASLAGSDWHNWRRYGV